MAGCTCILRILSFKGWFMVYVIRRALGGCSSVFVTHRLTCGQYIAKQVLPIVATAYLCYMRNMSTTLSTTYIEAWSSPGIEL